MSIPSDPSISYISVMLFLIGLFLFISGLNIIKVEKIFISHGFKTWFIGLLLMIASIAIAIPKILSDDNVLGGLTSSKATLNNSESGKFSGIPEDIVDKAMSGDMAFQAELGRILWVDKKDYTESLLWDQKAAIQGHTVAQWRMGAHYKDGVGTKKDYKSAVFWYEKSAQENNESSIKGLIEIYANGGYGVEKNIEKAKEWALKYSKIIPTPSDASSLLSALGDTPDIPNSGFERDEKYWIFEKHSEDYEKGIDSSVAYTGKNSAYIKAVVEKPSQFTTIPRFHPNIERLKGNRIRITSFIKTDSVEEAGIWARVDLENDGYILDNMMDRSIFGTNDWKQYEIILDVPTNSTGVVFGAIFNGTGKAWYDDFKFELVSKGTPTTEVDVKNYSKK